MQLAPEAKRDKHSIYKGDYKQKNKFNRVSTNKLSVTNNGTSNNKLERVSSKGANAFAPIAQIDEDSDEEDENCEVKPETISDVKDKNMGM